MWRTSSGTTFPHWHSVALKLAAVHHICRGLGAILFPDALFQIPGIDRLPSDSAVWQCHGMMAGVLGIGFWCASADPIRYWPIVLVGFLSTILEPVGILPAVLQERIPWIMGLPILTNDLIWWIPFASMLRNARCVWLNSKAPPRFDFSPARHGPSSRRRMTSAVVHLTVHASVDSRNREKN